MNDKQHFKIKPRMVFAHMRAASAYAATSYAKRLQVGCVLVDEDADQPVSIGWNGTAPGAPNICEKEVDGQLVSEGVIHAEENAINRLRWSYPFKKLTMFVTNSPCPDCTKKIIASGMVNKVVYLEPYRILDGVKELMAAGIQVYRMVDNHAVLHHVLTPEGEVGYEQVLTADYVRYIVITQRALTIDGTAKLAAFSDLAEFYTKIEAIDHGEKLVNCDDFNIGVISQGKLVSLDWYNDVVTANRKELDKIAEDLGI